MIRVIQRRLIIPRGDTGVFTIPAMTQAEGAIGVFTIFDPITNTRIFQKQVEIEGENFNISFSHADTVNLKAGEYLWDIKFYKNPILADNKVIDGEEINSYYAAFQAPKCEIRETGDDFLMIEGQPAKIEDLNIILAATEAANAAKVAATEKAEEAAAKLEEMVAAIPTKVSELENDSGYLQQETDPTIPAWAKAQTKPTYTAQEVGALPNNTFIPTKVSDLTDDSGHYTKPATGIPASDLEETYLTSFTETDPTVPNWAKQAQKPSYTAQEVGALPADTVIPTVPTNVSAFTNDAGYLTTHQDISMKANSADLAAVATSGSYNDLENKPFIPSKVSDLTDDSGHYTKPASGIPASDLAETYLTAHQDISGKADKSEIPTKVSQLQNDSGYLTSFTETDPTVPQWAKAATKPSYTAAEVGAPTVQEMNTAIGTAIGSVNSFDTAVVQELPTQDISTHTIYLVPKTGETNDVYDEYVYINNAWEMVGNTQIDLSNYVQKTDYATSDNAGIVKVFSGYGLDMIEGGYITFNPAPTALVKGGKSQKRIIAPYNQHEATFYGLATAAGDTTQSQSNNAVGTYTTEAKAAIQTMLDVPSTSDIPDVSIYATKADTVLDTTLSLGRLADSDVGENSIALGYDVTASGDYSFATGSETIASSDSAHAEGENTQATDSAAHAEGTYTEANGYASHAEGDSSVANGWFSHAEGSETAASGRSTHVFGERNFNTNKYPSENNEQRGTMVEIVGNGQGNGYSNARALTWTGDEYLAGNLYVNADATSTTGTRVATVTELAAKLDAAEAGLKVVRLI